MKILAIDTSCDETAASVTENTNILSNIVWSQASSHAKFGGVMPSLAQRMHEERIDWVISKALRSAKTNIDDIDSIAVTIGPGLSIALGVGIDRAKKLAREHNKKLIAVNHLEGHIYSPLANLEDGSLTFPCYGFVISGGNTILIKIEGVGKYEILAQTSDDALGEALDKAARMVGLGYPGGAVLEKIARGGDLSIYKLPIPIVGQESRQIFTYSGLKTAVSRLVESEKPLTKTKIKNLTATFQDTAFKHVIRILNYIFSEHLINNSLLLVGGGVSANVEIRKRIRKLCSSYKMKVMFPKSKKLYGDNAAMVGIAAYFNQNFVKPEDIDRKPNLKLN